jgi:hypothetical protein
VIFYSYVLNQFHLSIQCVQCDNGREFDNLDLCSFFAAKGIVFRFSCPHTSPQNGKAEQGIRSINDIIHTLLFQTHLTPSYWVEALHTARTCSTDVLVVRCTLSRPMNGCSYNLMIILI